MAARRTAMRLRRAIVRLNHPAVWVTGLYPASIHTESWEVQVVLYGPEPRDVSSIDKLSADFKVPVTYRERNW